MIVRSFLIVFSLYFVVATTATFGAVDSSTIKTRVEDFLAAYVDEITPHYPQASQITYQVSALDPRLAMADCHIPLQVERKSEQAVGNISLKVSCTGDNPWALYVPSEIKLFIPVVKTVRAINRGDVIAADDLQLQETDISRLRGDYFMQPDAVAGMQAKRALEPNQVVTAYQLEQPLLVKRGDEVIMTASSSGLSVRITGTAMNDGRRGEQISVRNNQSKRVVAARVVAAGQVAVSL